MPTKLYIYLLKDSLNNDSQLFRQYQQNEQ